MARKRKYPEVVGHWVYSIIVPSNGKYYIGISKLQCSQRWNKANYKSCSLNQYLEEWDSMIKTVLVDNLTKEEALQLEDALIQCLSRYNLCINEQRSVISEREYQEIKKQWQENNKEKKREYDKRYRENNKEKILERQRQRRLKKKLQKQQNSLPLT